MPLLGKALSKYNRPTLTDHRTPLSSNSQEESLDHLTACAADFEDIYQRCVQTYPDFGLSKADFRSAVVRSIDKYLLGYAARGQTSSTDDVRKFVGALQDLDLYLALACSQGNEAAWWQFDRQYRSFIERVARHLASSGMDADEVIESVYVDLFGTRVEGGVRQSKFRSYTGRGSLRGWLRTIIWHTVVDLYRRKQDEVPLEDFSRSGENRERQPLPLEEHGSEELMVTNVLRERYKSLSGAALDESLSTLDDHETLLLLYYHVEGLKLREIARLVEQPASPIRRWFQQQSRRRNAGSNSRVHESTVMRWLEKVYRKVSDRFRAVLAHKHGLTAAEIEICQRIAAEDVGRNVELKPTAPATPALSKGEAT